MWIKYSLPSILSTKILLERDTTAKKKQQKSKKKNQKRENVPIEQHLTEM